MVATGPWQRYKGMAMSGYTEGMWEVDQKRDGS